MYKHSTSNIYHMYHTLYVRLSSIKKFDRHCDIQRIQDKIQKQIYKYERC